MCPCAPMRFTGSMHAGFVLLVAGARPFPAVASHAHGPKQFLSLAGNMCNEGSRVNLGCSRHCGMVQPSMLEKCSRRMEATTAAAAPGMPGPCVHLAGPPSYGSKVGWFNPLLRRCTATRMASGWWKGDSPRGQAIKQPNSVCMKHPPSAGCALSGTSGLFVAALAPKLLAVPSGVPECICRGNRCANCHQCTAA